MSDKTEADEALSHHPVAQTKLYGHDGEQRAFLSALAADRLPHAWLISGAAGVGKATFAYAVARFILSQPRAFLVHRPPIKNPSMLG